MLNFTLYHRARTQTKKFSTSTTTKVVPRRGAFYVSCIQTFHSGILLQTHLKYMFRSTRMAQWEELMITAALRSCDTLTAVSGTVVVGLMASPCTLPCHSATLMLPRFAPSKESKMSLKSVKGNTRPETEQQRNDIEVEEGDLLLSLWSISEHHNMWNPPIKALKTGVKQISSGMLKNYIWHMTTTFLQQYLTLPYIPLYWKHLLNRRFNVFQEISA